MYYINRCFKEYETNAKYIVNRYPWGGRDNEWKYRVERRKADVCQGCGKEGDQGHDGGDTPNSITE